jgi:hypothetical protein
MPRLPKIPKINIVIMFIIDFLEISNLFTFEDVIRMGYSDFSYMEQKLLEEVKLVDARQVNDGVPQEVDENQKRIYLASSLAEVLSQFGIEKAIVSQFANEKGVEPQRGCSRAVTTDASVETTKNASEGESVEGQLLIKMKWLLGHIVDKQFVLIPKTYCLERLMFCLTMKVRMKRHESLQLFWQL